MKVAVGRRYSSRNCSDRVSTIFYLNSVLRKIVDTIISSKTSSVMFLVIFFTRANTQLKQKNEGLESMLISARSQLAEGGGGGDASTSAGGAKAPAMTDAAESGPAPSDTGNSVLMDQKPAATSSTAPSSSPATTAQQAMLQNNWLALMGVPNPMYNNPAALLGMGNSFLGQFQQQQAEASQQQQVLAAAGGAGSGNNNAGDEGESSAAATNSGASASL